MASTHFTLAEAAEHLPNLLERAIAGEEILIDRPGLTPFTLQVAEPARVALGLGNLGRSELNRDASIKATLARARDYEQTHGPLVMDLDFVEDMRNIVASRKQGHGDPWIP